MALEVRLKTESKFSGLNSLSLGGKKLFLVIGLSDGVNNVQRIFESFLTILLLLQILDIKNYVSCKWRRAEKI